MKFKLVVWLLVLALMGLSAGFSTAQAGTFAGAWPYSVPPDGHFNSYVTRGILLDAANAYRDIIESPLALYLWADDSYEGQLATDWGFDGNTFTVHLREGVVLEDGSAFTAQDVLTTFHTGYLMNWIVWRYLDRIEAEGDYTVHFVMDRPSTVVQRHVLRTQIRAHSTYGHFGDQVAELLAAGHDLDSDAMRPLVGELGDFRPDGVVATGPYTIDQNSITESQLTLRRVPTAWNADIVNFDNIVVFNGETPAITPLVLSQDVDYATHGFPTATERRFIQDGVRILRPALYSGPALYFNHNIYPLNQAEVRRAMAHAINKVENAIISLGDSAQAQEYMTGLSDNLAPLWIDADVLGSMNRYEFDRDRATEIFEGLGFSRGGDGVWVDDMGNRMSYDLSFPAEFADWSAAAENAAEQLRDFGIEISLQGTPHVQHPIDVNEGRFELAIRAWGAGNPHPQFSYNQNLLVHNYVMAAEGDGMNFDLNVVTERYGALDLDELVTQAAEGLSDAEQQANITRLAAAFNELLPIVPLWERYGNNATLEDVRVSGWPDDDHPVYNNPPYTDPLISILILDGTLRPAQ